LADRFVAFLAGARFAGDVAGARRTALLADRFALFLAGARFAATVAGERLTIFASGPRAVLVAGAFRTAFVAAGLAAFFFGATLTLKARSGVLPFTMSFRVVLAEKRTPLAAAILTGAPVCGLRPIRAPRCVGLKLPNPTTATRRPLRTSLTTAWTNALTASSASRRVSDVVSLIASIRPDLFTRCPPPCSGIPSIKEGFRVKVKHLRCWGKVTRKDLRKIARLQLRDRQLDAKCQLKGRRDAYGQETLRLQGFFPCRSFPTVSTT